MEFETISFNDLFIIAMTLMGQVIYLKVSFPSAVPSDALSMPVLFAYLGIMMSAAYLTLMVLTGRAVSAET